MRTSSRMRTCCALLTAVAIIGCSSTGAEDSEREPASVTLARAREYARGGEQEAALEAYAAVLPEIPGRITRDEYHYISEAYVARGAYERAGSAMDQLISIHRREPGHWLGRSGIDERAGLYTEAVFAAWMEVEYLRVEESLSRETLGEPH